MCWMVLLPCVLHWTICLAISHAIFVATPLAPRLLHSRRFFRMTVEIEDFASLGAILDESQIYIGGGKQYI